jgi:hypothetical protein
MDIFRPRFIFFCLRKLLKYATPSVHLCKTWTQNSTAQNVAKRTNIPLIDLIDLKFEKLLITLFLPRVARSIAPSMYLNHGVHGNLCKENYKETPFLLFSSLSQTTETSNKIISCIKN